MSVPQSEHVILTDGGGWRCERCGDAYRMPLPVPVPVYVAACRAFARLHARCPVIKVEVRK